ncbi:hypothetical protein [Paenibacillus alba]|uniref:Uncharacterized protein n=1 Tax=Paenibacillus alba TaxID=1197127 RepID=A0ABU6GAD3_9BACL|nr:hypothetical protein [Paenibacillus alba]MEC0231157.1 hypothetical protein [Paenibacillus alba]
MKNSSIVLKGIVRGTFSQFQPYCPEEPAVMKFEGTSLSDVIQGLVLDEWIFTLKVNGRRIKNPFQYIKRSGLNPIEYMRAGVIL